MCGPNARSTYAVTNVRVCMLSPRQEYICRHYSMSTRVVTMAGVPRCHSGKTTCAVTMPGYMCCHDARSIRVFTMAKVHMLSQWQKYTCCHDSRTLRALTMAGIYVPSRWQVYTCGHNESITGVITMLGVYLQQWQEYTYHDSGRSIRAISAARILRMIMEGKEFP